MVLAYLTLLSALSLAAVSAWFSIVGFMTIYAGAPLAALIMGIVAECAKLVTASWLYRNWKYAPWSLKAPLIYALIALMVATSTGVFGFLSKAHLEQSSSTLDNTPKIEQISYRIAREQARIADNEKIIAQLDQTVNSFIDRNLTNRSITVRKSQEAQRNLLKDDIAEAQATIDGLNEEKFQLESDVRKLELEVGPIRYISELIYGVNEDAKKGIEAAVRYFTLLIVSTLDPLAVILLIAANHTIVRLQNSSKSSKEYNYAETGVKSNEVEEDLAPQDHSSWGSVPAAGHVSEALRSDSNGRDLGSIGSVEGKAPTTAVINNEEEESNTEESSDPGIYSTLPREENEVSVPNEKLENVNEAPYHVQVPRSEEAAETVEETIPVERVKPWAPQESMLHELVGYRHFIPESVNEKEKESSGKNEKHPPVQNMAVRTIDRRVGNQLPIQQVGVPEEKKEESVPDVSSDNTADAKKAPKALSWINEFRRP